MRRQEPAAPKRGYDDPVMNLSRKGLLLRGLVVTIALALFLASGISFWLRSQLRASLPQLDGSLTLAGLRCPSWRTDTRLPGSACCRRTNASAIGRSSPGDHTALVTLPMAASSATTSAPGGGTSRPSSTSPRSIRLTCPRSRIRTTTS